MIAMFYYSVILFLNTMEENVPFGASDKWKSVFIKFMNLFI